MANVTGIFCWISTSRYAIPFIFFLKESATSVSLNRPGSILAPHKSKRPTFKNACPINTGVPKAIPTAPPVVVDLGNSSPKKESHFATKAAEDVSLAVVEEKGDFRAGSKDVKQASVEAIVDAKLCVGVTNEGKAIRNVGQSSKEGEGLH